MDRGHYYVIDQGGKRCRHRHYELSRLLARCRDDLSGSVWYASAGGSTRPARPDELEELAEHVPRAPGRPPTGTGRGAPKVAISHEAMAIAVAAAHERGVSVPAVVDEAVRALRRPAK